MQPIDSDASFVEPGGLEPGGLEPEGPPPGYVSAEAKSGFVKRVLVAAVAAGVIQIVVPMIGSAIAMATTMMAANNVKKVDPEKGTFWKGSLWLVVADEALDGTGGTTLLKWVPGEDNEPDEAKLPPVDVLGLLSNDERLFALGGDVVVEMKASGVEPMAAKKGLANPSRPFFWKGAPTVVDWEETDVGDTNLSLKTWDGLTWSVPEGPLPDLEAETNLYPPSIIFLNSPDGVFALTMEPGEIRGRRSLDGFAKLPTEEWEIQQEVPVGTYIWTADFIDDRLALFAVVREGLSERVQGWIERDGEMAPLVDTDIGLVRDISVYPTGDGEKYLLITLGSTGSVIARAMDGGEELYRTRIYASPIPNGGESMNISIVSSLLGLLPSLIAALLIASWIRRDKTAIVETDFGTVELASLGSRGLALLVDGGIAIVPVVIAWFAVAGLDPFDMDQRGAQGIMSVLAVMGIGSAWLILCMIVYSAMEAGGGQTPGKRIAKIKVLHIDMGPPGFGRAFVRNFFKFVVDITFDYLLGVVLIALTKKRQRVGDLVAKTIVVTADSVSSERAR